MEVLYSLSGNDYLTYKRANHLQASQIFETRIDLVVSLQVIGPGNVAIQQRLSDCRSS